VLLTQPAREIGDFELTDQNGQPFHFRQLQGKTVLVFFGFTQCPDVCPLTLHKLKLLTASLERAQSPAPTVVMISVDGERDTPAAMKAYLEPFSDRFIGLTGDPLAIRKIAARFLAVFFKGLPAGESAGYLVEHTSQTYLVDSDGRLHATFADAAVEQMSEAIKPLLLATARKEADRD